MENFCGKRLDGRYEIQEIIGVGGMAVVYKAYDNIDDRIVAIKILKDEYLTNEEFKKRFKNESKAIAVLSHPNIVRVYNVSFGDRIQYIVMEYVDGITLKEYIEQQGVINWKEAVHFTGQILAALQHAHDKGIVHQDIKPQNIMLLQDGTIKVTDFGIARFSRVDNNTTSENAIGSVHYISPEQARGEATDDKADIYSVGVVMYEMLTGKLPFQADTAVSVALMQVQQDPVRPRDLMPTLPLGLEQITMRAMQKNPNDRYQSAAEMLMDINEFKRNPAIKFNYSYFVDKEPTKYVGVESKNLSNFDENDEPEEKKKGINKTTAIALGAVAGVVVLALIIAGVLIGIKNKKIIVPNFLNTQINDVLENEEFNNNFDIQIIYDETSEKEQGTIISQNPKASTKVKKGSELILTVAGTQGETVVIDAKILSMDEKKAKEYLIEQGLQTKESVLEYSDSIAPGTVIRTEPAVGTSVEIGSGVTLYIATDEKEKVLVPDILGCDLKKAEELLENSKLELGIVKEVNSDLEKGKVVSQSISKDKSVTMGTKIDIEISNGIPNKTEASIKVVLPNTQKKGVVKIYVDGTLAYTSSELTLDGSKETFTVEGKGKDVKYVVYVDKTVVQEGKIDFTKSPAVVTVSSDNKTAIVPNVVGQTKDEAISKLKKAGFNNYKINEVESSEPTGIVLKQTPNSGESSSTDTTITIDVSIVKTTQNETKPNDDSGSNGSSEETTKAE